MVSISEIRKKFVKRIMKRRPVGLKLTRLGKKFKVKKYKWGGKNNMVRVTIKKVGGGYDVSKNGRAVEFAKTKAEAKMKAVRLRKLLKK